MCLIIHKPKSKTEIPSHIIDNAETLNPDGFGILFTDTNELVKTMCYEEARYLISQKRPFVAHYRYATVGTVNLENVHPFEFTGGHLFSNGTVGNLGDRHKSDTRVVSEYLEQIPTELRSVFFSMTETRFAIVSKDGTVSRFGEWHKKGGVYYSKSNCFPKKVSTFAYGKTSGTKSNSFGTSYDYSSYGYSWDDGYVDPWDVVGEDSWDDCNVLAVYGTLKQGGGNNSRYLFDASYLGHGVTAQKLRMQAEGIPFLYEGEHPDGNHVEVEFYEVTDDSSRTALDALEGHPTMYERKQAEFIDSTGERVIAWVYYYNGEPSPHKQCLSEF